MDNRTRLMHEALKLFAARGYDAVGVQEIVEAAGLTKPSLYHHFGSKLGLLRDLLARHGEPVRQGLAEAARYEGDLPLTLNRVVRRSFELARRDPDYHRLAFALWLAPPESEAGAVFAEQWRAESALFVALFEAASRDHGNMRGRARLHATGFSAVIHAHTGLFLRGEAELDDELAFRVVHAFMHGIYA